MVKLTFKTNRKLKETYIFNQKKELLGMIYFERRWSCFVWVQEENMCMSYICLKMIMNEMERLSKEYGVDLK